MRALIKTQKEKNTKREKYFNWDSLRALELGDNGILWCSLFHL